jgi:hypothetical protein
MHSLIEFPIKPETLVRYGLPDIAYHVFLSDSESTSLADGELPLSEMLYGLQLRSRNGDAPWRQFEPAMNRLGKLLMSDCDREVIALAGKTWWLEFGPVDLSAKLVTIQRNDVLIAAIAPRRDGRLRVATFRPLDAKSAEYLIGLGQVPDAEHGVCMRESNWEYALDCSAGTGNWYAFDRGEAHLSNWGKGLGISSDDSVLPTWRQQLSLVNRAATQVVKELEIYCTFSGKRSH